MFGSATIPPGVREVAATLLLASGQASLLSEQSLDLRFDRALVEAEPERLVFTRLHQAVVSVRPLTAGETSPVLQRRLAFQGLVDPALTVWVVASYVDTQDERGLPVQVEMDQSAHPTAEMAVIEALTAVFRARLFEHLAALAPADPASPGPRPADRADSVDRIAEQLLVQHLHLDGPAV